MDIKDFISDLYFKICFEYIFIPLISGLRDLAFDVKCNSGACESYFLDRCMVFIGLGRSSFLTLKNPGPPLSTIGYSARPHQPFQKRDRE